MSSKHTHLEQQKKTLTAKATLNEKQKDHYRLYWDLTSPYSNKARIYLNYKNIPYQLIQTTNRDFMKKIPAWAGMPIMPIVLTPDDRVMQDTTPIMEWFEKEYSEKPAIPEDPRLAWLMWLLEEFSDEYLLRLTMRKRWGNEASRRTVSSRISRGFSYGYPNEIIKMGAEFIRDRQITNMDTLLAIAKEEDCKSVDQQMLDLLAILDTHFLETAYLLGDRPSLSDFAFFGFLWSYGFNEPALVAIMEVNAPQVCNWLQEIADLGDHRGCVGREEFGDWLDLEEGLPDSILQLIQFIAKTYLPLAMGCRDAMFNGDKRVRAVIYGVETELPRFDYKVGTFAQLQQKLTDLNDSQKKWLENTLSETGLFPSLLDGGIKPNPHFADLTPPFVTDPDKSRLAVQYIKEGS